jgi:hypothetical protein
VIHRATADDVEEIVAIFEPSFGLLDFLPQLHTHEEYLGFFAGRVRRFYEAHGAVAVELTEGEHNEEQTPDVGYEWKPSA